MKYESLFHELKNLEGQSIEVHTVDGKIHSGINLAASGNAVRLLDRYGRTSFIPFEHICAVVEPMAKIEPDLDDQLGTDDEAESQYGDID